MLETTKKSLNLVLIAANKRPSLKITTKLNILTKLSEISLLNNVSKDQSVENFAEMSNSSNLAK